MVKWIRDATGRFHERPHYEAQEIDNECEREVIQHLRKAHGRVVYPLTTDDLTNLIETKVRDLDIYADLSADGPDVEGVTRFAKATRPIIEVAAHLSESETRQNRFRTTLAHELGHVLFHDSLVQMKLGAGDLFSRATEERIVCKRDRMVDAPWKDWMEWQACYASGARLMPKSAMTAAASEYRQGAGHHGPITPGSEHGQRLIGLVQDRFVTSADAARVRLLKLKLLSDDTRQGSLFG